MTRRTAPPKISTTPTPPAPDSTEVAEAKAAEAKAAEAKAAEAKAAEAKAAEAPKAKPKTISVPAGSNTPGLPPPSERKN